MILYHKSSDFCFVLDSIANKENKWRHTIRTRDDIVAAIVREDDDAVLLNTILQVLNFPGCVYHAGGEAEAAAVKLGKDGDTLVETNDSDPAALLRVSSFTVKKGTLVFADHIKLAEQVLSAAVSMIRAKVTPERRAALRLITGAFRDKLDPGDGDDGISAAFPTAFDSDELFEEMLATIDLKSLGPCDFSTNAMFLACDYTPTQLKISGCGPRTNAAVSLLVQLCFGTSVSPVTIHVLVGRFVEVALAFGLIKPDADGIAEWGAALHEPGFSEHLLRCHEDAVNPIVLRQTGNADEPKRLERLNGDSVVPRFDLDLSNFGFVPRTRINAAFEAKLQTWVAEIRAADSSLNTDSPEGRLAIVNRLPFDSSACTFANIDRVDAEMERQRQADDDEAVAADMSEEVDDQRRGLGNSLDIDVWNARAVEETPVLIGNLQRFPADTAKGAALRAAIEPADIARPPNNAQVKFLGSGDSGVVSFNVSALKPFDQRIVQGSLNSLRQHQEHYMEQEAKHDVRAELQLASTALLGRIPIRDDRMWADSALAVGRATFSLLESIAGLDFQSELARLANAGNYAEALCLLHKGAEIAPDAQLAAAASGPVAVVDLSSNGGTCRTNSRGAGIYMCFAGRPMTIPAGDYDRLSDGKAALALTMMRAVHTKYLSLVVAAPSPEWTAFFVRGEAAPQSKSVRDGIVLSTGRCLSGILRASPDNADLRSLVDVSGLPALLEASAGGFLSHGLSAAVALQPNDKRLTKLGSIYNTSGNDQACVGKAHANVEMLVLADKQRVLLEMRRTATSLGEALRTERMSSGPLQAIFEGRQPLHPRTAWENGLDIISCEIVSILCDNPELSEEGARIRSMLDTCQLAPVFGFNDLFDPEKQRCDPICALGNCSPHNVLFFIWSKIIDRKGAKWQPDIAPYSLRALRLYCDLYTEDEDVEPAAA